jgi:2'-5' RNA ligase
MRLFLALNLPPAERERIRRASGPLRAAGLPVRWAETDALHLTLKFLGEVADARAADVRAAAARVAGDFTGFDYELRGLGGFPNLRAPRVVWVGVRAPPALPRLAAALDQAMAGLGFPREERPFSAHLTLGRAERGAGAGAFGKLAALAAGFDYAARIEARSLDLMRSHLSPRGARYECIAAAPLRGGPGVDAAVAHRSAAGPAGGEGK